MFDLFTNINVNWMGLRKPLIAVSVVVLLAGLGSALVRQLTPGGTSAFNLGVDFQGGSVITAKFKGGKPSPEELRKALAAKGVGDAVIQSSTDKQDEVLIKIPLIEGSDSKEPAPAQKPEKPEEAKANGEETKAESSGKDSESDKGQSDDGKAGDTKSDSTSNQVSGGRDLVNSALKTFGKEAKPELTLAADKEAKYKIVGTDSVGPVAGDQLRTQAVIATLLGMGGILLFIAFRYDWTYAAGAVIAVFHDVLITLAFFTVFQWEVSLTVLAAFLTLVGFSVNDSIVIFDRIRENLTLKKGKSLFALTNDSINQTMSRTIVTNGLVFLTVLALVLFGGEVLRGFSLALFVGSISGTYSTIAIASPIAIWWQSKLGEAEMKEVAVEESKGLASAARKSVKRRPVTG
ncbi:MAG: protein translocase subunit SecF [Pyrinomonadaceae bacterium]